MCRCGCRPSPASLPVCFSLARQARVVIMRPPSVSAKEGSACSFLPNVASTFQRRARPRVRRHGEVAFAHTRIATCVENSTFLVRRNSLGQPWFRFDSSDARLPGEVVGTSVDEEWNGTWLGMHGLARRLSRHRAFFVLSSCLLRNCAMLRERIALRLHAGRKVKRRRGGVVVHIRKGSIPCPATASSCWTGIASH